MFTLLSNIAHNSKSAKGLNSNQDINVNVDYNQNMKIALDKTRNSMEVSSFTPTRRNEKDNYHNARKNLYIKDSSLERSHTNGNHKNGYDHYGLNKPNLSNSHLPKINHNPETMGKCL